MCCGRGGADHCVFQLRSAARLNEASSGVQGQGICSSEQGWEYLELVRVAKMVPELCARNNNYSKVLAPTSTGSGEIMGASRKGHNGGYRRNRRNGDF